MAIRFEWDPGKERRNRHKHGVGFDEASTVFADTLSITIPDPDHSDGEERWVTMGLSHRNRLLVVVHTEEDEQQIVRIISARPRSLSMRMRQGVSEFSVAPPC